MSMTNNSSREDDLANYEFDEEREWDAADPDWRERASERGY